MSYRQGGPRPGRTYRAVGRLFGRRTRPLGYSRAGITALAKSGWNTLKSAAVQQTPNALALAAKRYNSTKKSIHQPAINLGTSGSFSNFYYTPRKEPRAFRLIKKGISNNYLVNNNAVRLNASVGSQNNNTVNNMFNQTDLALISSKISSNNTQKFICKSCSAETMITNQDVGNVRIYIYDIIARRDLTSSGVSNPSNAWNNSYTDEGGSGTSNQIVGTTPFSGDTFTQFYRVVKITHCTLAQGQTHTHRVRFAPNKIIDEEVVNNVSNGVKGLSTFTMLVYHGVPYNDLTTQSQVSTGAVALDVVTRRQYKYSWMNDSTTSFSSTNSLPSSFTVQEEVMDIGTGAKVIDSSA